MEILKNEIERLSLIKKLYQQNAPLKYFYKGREYDWKITEVRGKEICFKANKPMQDFKRNRVELYAVCNSILSSFITRIKPGDNKDGENINFIGAIPREIYTKLDRDYPRVEVLSHVDIRFKFLAERYYLPCPAQEGFTVLQYESIETDENSGENGQQIIKDFLEKTTEWVKARSRQCGVVFFSEKRRPKRIEEFLIAETGKIFAYPFVDTVNQELSEKFIREQNIEDFFEKKGAEPKKALADFLIKKQKNIFELWLPVLFQQYTIAYIYVSLDLQRYNIMTPDEIDKLNGEGEELVRSLKRIGYFKNGLLTGKWLKPSLENISPNGFLFSFDNPILGSCFHSQTDLETKILLKERCIDTTVRTLRSYKIDDITYAGGQFLDLQEEDKKFLYQYIYGKPYQEGTGIDFFN